MDFSSVFARVVAVIGGAALTVRKIQGVPEVAAWGAAPAIPEAKSQGAIPTLKMPSARGWSAGQKPIAAPGLKVNAFATGLDHPRWIEVLPNGDVLIAEATKIAGAAPHASTVGTPCILRIVSAAPPISATTFANTSETPMEP